MEPRPVTVIYDGTCAYCRRWVERVRRWDRHERLTFLPYQSPDLDARFPQVSRAECRLRIHLVDGQGAVFKGATAGREILRRLPGGSFWILPFHLPGGLAVAERIYTWITRRWGPVPAHPPIA
jgi:predicted DCC family thiol-disulfide oxidoreductase YuxK